MDFHTQVVALGVLGRHAGEVFAVTKADFDRASRLATKKDAQIQKTRRGELHAILRPQRFQRPFLCCCDPSGADDKRANGARVFGIDHATGTDCGGCACYANPPPTGSQPLALPWRTEGLVGSDLQSNRGYVHATLLVWWICGHVVPCCLVQKCVE